MLETETTSPWLILHVRIHRNETMQHENMKLQQEAINIFTKCSEMKTSNFTARSNVTALIDSSKDICFFCFILIYLDTFNYVLWSLSIKKISQLKCIKRQNQLGVFCLFAFLHITYTEKRRSLWCAAALHVTGVQNWPASESTSKGFTQRRAASPRSRAITQPSLKGSVRLHLEVSGDPQGLWGHKYSYRELLIKKKHYKNAAL